MSFAETCSRCGEEVRWGTRDGVLKYHHRDSGVDHEPLFGTLAGGEIDWETVSRPRQKTGEEDDRIWEIPAPEVYATEIDLGDPRLPNGAKNLIKAVDKVEGRRRATYSRGPRTHGEHGNLLGISDVVVVRFRVEDRTGTGCWWDGKLDWAWITHYDHTIAEVTVQKVTAAELRAHLVPKT